MSIKFNLYGYAGVENVYARFDAEGDSIKKIEFNKKHSFRTFGTFWVSDCVFSSGGSLIAHRDFHIQPMINNRNAGDVLYKINVFFGGITGSETSKQRSKFFKIDDKEYVMNYGVSHASDEEPAKLGDQAYLYLSTTKQNWMKEFLTTNPLIKNIVLPGAHDAGMWKVDENFINKVITGGIPLSFIVSLIPHIGLLLAAAGTAATANIATILYNTAVTQKDSILDLLRMGIRFFDFRPAKHKLLDDSIVHVHGAIPGGKFDEFLQQLNVFIHENPTEIVFVEIKNDGISSKLADFITEDELERIAKEKLNVNFRILSGDQIENLNTLNWFALNDRNTKYIGQVVFLYKVNTKTSYNDSDYGSSMVCSKNVESAVQKFIKEIDNEHLNLIQVQNTATLFLRDNIHKFVIHPSWVNNIVLSDTGSLLADTKARFDATLYWLLINDQSLVDFKKRSGLTAIINDFADIALVDLSIALTKHRISN